MAETYDPAPEKELTLDALRAKADKMATSMEEELNDMKLKYLRRIHKDTSKLSITGFRKDDRMISEKENIILQKQQIQDLTGRLRGISEHKDNIIRQQEDQIQDLTEQLQKTTEKKADIIRAQDNEIQGLAGQLRETAEEKDDMIRQREAQIEVLIDQLGQVTTLLQQAEQNNLAERFRMRRNVAALEPLIRAKEQQVFALRYALLERDHRIARGCQGHAQMLRDMEQDCGRYRAFLHQQIDQRNNQMQDLQHRVEHLEHLEALVPGQDTWIERQAETIDALEANYEDLHQRHQVVVAELDGARSEIETMSREYHEGQERRSLGLLLFDDEDTSTAADSEEEIVFPGRKRKRDGDEHEDANGRQRSRYESPLRSLDRVKPELQEPEYDGDSDSDSENDYATPPLIPPPALSDSESQDEESDMSPPPPNTPTHAIVADPAIRYSGAHHFRFDLE